MPGFSLQRARQRRCFAFVAGLTLWEPAGVFAEDSRWTSRVASDARGEIRVIDGTAIQIRYKEWGNQDFGAYPTHAYADKRTGTPVQHVNPPVPPGDPAEGKKIWETVPCVNCHALAEDARWAGNMGPDLSVYGDRAVPRERTYQIIHDPRALFPDTLMPAWGAAGLLSPDQVAHVTAYLHSLRSPAAVPTDADWKPETRPIPNRYFGDNLDPTNNAAVVFAETAEDKWATPGPKGKSCASCHGRDIRKSMRGVATAYPRYHKRYRRVVSLEDFLSAHAPVTTGDALPVQGPENLNMTVLIKMASNGLPLNIDTNTADAKAAWNRGKNTFYKRIGQRNHACSDCHAPERAGGKWLGGRYLGRVTTAGGLTLGYPAWRTSFAEVWSIRKRFQWCMLPHGANYLSADAEEYADLEFYLASFDIGKKISTPGLKD